ncbi:MAG: TetR/AcrR family transcriptional regulator, partial [Pseudomonadota bacterium]
MPWEKSFDMDDAVARAMKVFWAKGYEATSISDLVNGMGINKGSLYNAFGSKKDLFTRVVLKYDRENQQETIAHLEALDDPVVALTTLFDGLIAESAADTERKGCFLVNTALELPSHDEDIREMIKSAFADMEAFLRGQITLGQERGAIPEEVKAGETAKSILSLIVGLRVLARGVFDVAALRAIKSDALRLISA